MQEKDLAKDEIVVAQLTFQAYLKSETNEISKSFLLLKAAIQKSKNISLAKAFSNYSVLKRQQGDLDEAKEYMDRAWNTTILYLRGELEMGHMSNYLDLAVRATGLEGDQVQRGFRVGNEYREKKLKNLTGDLNITYV